MATSILKQILDYFHRSSGPSSLSAKDRLFAFGMSLLVAASKRCSSGIGC